MHDLSEFVVLSDTTLTTDSRRVAKHFGKRHDRVLRAIRDLLESASTEFTDSNFGVSEFTDSTGRTLPMYRITKDGFMLLAMGFTGKEAMKTKIAFIDAFNAMAEQLQQIGMSLWNQRLELEKRDATTFMWASFGAKRMNERKKALPQINEDRERLASEMQPALFSLETKPH